MIHNWVHGPAVQHVPGIPPRIALDAHIGGSRVAKILRRYGVEVPVWAQSGESDDAFFRRCLAADVHAIASADYDLGLLCWTGGVMWVPCIPGAPAAEEQVDWILHHLRTWRML